MNFDGGNNTLPVRCSGSTGRGTFCSLVCLFVRLFYFVSVQGRVFPLPRPSTSMGITSPARPARYSASSERGIVLCVSFSCDDVDFPLATLNINRDEHMFPAWCPAAAAAAAGAWTGPATTPIFPAACPWSASTHSRWSIRLDGCAGAGSRRLALVACNPSVQSFCSACADIVPVVFCVTCLENVYLYCTCCCCVIPRTSTWYKPGACYAQQPRVKSRQVISIG